LASNYSIMTIHHLELFYYVAKHGGIAAAVRKMPYGIQQPAVSGQIARLEEDLGAKLFNRRPFSLLPEGAELFEFIKPFFDDLDKVAARIRGPSLQLRIAAPPVVLHDYVPELLQRVRRRFPSFRLQLHEAAGADAERLLLAGDIDLAITILDGKRRSEIHSRPLLELPLILLVNKKQNIRRAEQLWARDKIEETLITFPRSDAVQAHFQRGLEQLGVEWFPGIEVNSTRLIDHYVAHGYGIGLTVAPPAFKSPPGMRAILLPGFPPVTIGAAWAEKLSPIAQQFLAEVEIEATVVKRGSKLP
jgi:DNA-binding transcriptional LysR family regulator